MIEKEFILQNDGKTVEAALNAGKDMAELRDSVGKELSEKRKNFEREISDYQAQLGKLKVELFSDQKAKDLNKLYEEYINSSIKDSFQRQKSIQEKELELRKKEVELELKSTRVDAELELKELEEKIRKTKFKTKDKVLWIIGSVLTGIVLGIITAIVL